jgi:hippurate hydrolase
MPEITEVSLQPLRQMMVDFRRDLHQHPELGFEETRTAGKVAEALRSFGVEVHEGIGGTGVVGVLRNGGGNRTVMLRADMDALPIIETSTHDYPSKSSGKMHACGHDGHTTMLLGAAKYLAENLPFTGTVLFLFQPNEEHGLGAKAMIKDGLISQFQPEEVYGIHNLPGAPLGEISSRTGTICASESLFEFEIFGQGGHASMPQVGVDAILVGAELVQALQNIVARKLAPSTGAVVSVTEFITDGQRNVLPGHALLKGDTRSFTAHDRAEIERLMRRIAKGIATAHDVRIDVRFATEFMETVNAAEQVKVAMQAAGGISDKVIPERGQMSFSEDFGCLSHEIPGCFLLMGNGCDYPHSQPLHASDYEFNEDALTLGAAFWARLVSERLPKKDA